MERENLRFVPIKTEDQLDRQALHRVRDRLVARRTSVINQIRAFLLERGISFGKGPASLRRQLPEILENVDEQLSPRMRLTAGFPLARVERLAVADRESERGSRTDREQRSGMRSAAANSWSRSTDCDRRSFGYRQRRCFPKRTRVLRLAGPCTTTMVNRRQDEVVGHQQARKSLSTKDVHSWSTGCGLTSQT